MNHERRGKKLLDYSLTWELEMGKLIGIRIKSRSYNSKTGLRFLLWFHFPIGHREIYCWLVFPSNSCGGNCDFMQWMKICFYIHSLILLKLLFLFLWFTVWCLIFVTISVCEMAKYFSPFWKDLRIRNSLRDDIFEFLIRCLIIIFGLIANLNMFHNSLSILAVSRSKVDQEYVSTWYDKRRYHVTDYRARILWPREFFRTNSLISSFFFLSLIICALFWHSY